MDCRITGVLTNIVFYGNEAPRSRRTRFTRVDLSGAKLIDTGFQSGLKKEEIIPARSPAANKKLTTD